MSWEKELEEKVSREKLSENLGGKDRIKKQHDAGLYTIRERIDILTDKSSFNEVGKLAGHAIYNENNDLIDFKGSNFIFGKAKIDGRNIVVGGDDFTLRGGSADASIKEKHLKCEQMALSLQLPLIRIVEGSGGGGSVKTIETSGRANVPEVEGWNLVVESMGTIPRVALGLGSVAGLGAAHLACSHYSVMVKEKSAVFVAGPPVVEQIGQKLSKNELGGYEIQLKSGAVDDAVDTEEEAFDAAKKFLSYLPNSVYQLSDQIISKDDPKRTSEWLIEAIPKNIKSVYKIRPIIEDLVDKGSFFEIGKEYGKSIVTGFCRLNGWPIALMASDPYSYGGCWTSDTCKKVQKFVDLAETFHLPVIYLVDCPGFQVGLDAEKKGTIKEGVRAMSAIWQTKTPWMSIIIRNCFGVAGAAHKRGSSYISRFAWPSARWGSLPLEGGIEAAYRSDIENANDPKLELQKITTRLNKLRSPFRSAESFLIEEIIDPRHTRKIMCEFADLSAPLRKTGITSRTMRP